MRTVPLPDPVAEAMALHLERFASDRTDFVFTQPDGSPVSKSTLSSMWHATMQNAGIKRRRFHHLRHYYTSLLIAHGASVKVVQARLGHATAVETLDTYGHLCRISTTSLELRSPRRGLSARVSPQSQGRNRNSDESRTFGSSVQAWGSASLGAFHPWPAVNQGDPHRQPRAERSAARLSRITAR